MIPGLRSLAARLVVSLPFACGGAATLADDPGAGGVTSVSPGDVQWKADSRGPGIFTAVVAGDPKQPGLYVLRVRMLQDAKLPPHRHPDLRSVTVLSGEFYLGVGEVFEVGKMKAYPAGSHIMIPPNVPHFGWVKSGESIQQDCGWGPTGSTPVTPSASR
jgi:quercetin dioxygenase-like cupin family protein